MASNFAFTPMGQCYTVVVGATSATATITLAGPAITTGNYLPGGVRIANLGTVAAFVQFGAGTPTVAVTTGMPIFANTIETFQLKGQNKLVHTSVGTCTLYIQPGEGL